MTPGGELGALWADVLTAAAGASIPNMTTATIGTQRLIFMTSPFALTLTSVADR